MVATLQLVHTVIRPGLGETLRWNVGPSRGEIEREGGSSLK